MAEALALGASVIAFLQLADRVIWLCKFYIETVRDAPNDLRIILMEISGLKAVLDTVSFLLHADPDSVSKVIWNLDGQDGPLSACRLSLGKLEKLFPADHPWQNGQGCQFKQQKVRKVSQILVTLAWPLQANKARALLDDILRHKATITLALSTESR
jgi:hypothetical protein